MATMPCGDDGRFEGGRGINNSPTPLAHSWSCLGECVFIRGPGHIKLRRLAED